MGRKEKWLAILAVPLVLLCGCFKRSQPVEIGEIRSFRFSYTEGTMRGSTVEYTLTREDDVCRAIIKAKGVPVEERKTVEVDEAFVKRPEGLLRDNEVDKWNGFDKSSKYGADADGFTLSIYMMDETELYAHGYMKWPDNFGTVRDGIAAMFAELEK